MKKWIVCYTFLLLIVSLSLSFPGPAQEQTIKRKNVPKVVLDAFEKAYPKAKVRGFSKETEEGKVLYEIESSEGKAVRDVTYAPDGSLVSVEETLPVEDFPEAVRAALKREFPGAGVTKSERVTKGSIVQYEVLLKSNKGSYEVLFESDGKVTKKEEIGRNRGKD